MSILELFSDKRPSLSISEVAELTGLNRATCYRFCQTFRQLGYLEELPDRRFRPGLKAVSLAHSALSSRELPELALPYLERLRAITSVVIPDASFLRNAEHRVLFLSGLRLAAGETP